MWGRDLRCFSWGLCACQEVLIRGCCCFCVPICTKVLFTGGAVGCSLPLRWPSSAPVLFRLAQPWALRSSSLVPCTGQAMGGTISAIASLIDLAAAPNVTDSALAYFFTADIFIVICIMVYLLLPRLEYSRCVHQPAMDIPQARVGSVCNIDANQGCWGDPWDACCAGSCPVTHRHATSHPTCSGSGTVRWHQLCFRI